MFNGHLMGNRPTTGNAGQLIEDSLLLLELSRDVTGSLDLQEVLDKSLAAMRRLVDFGGGAIQLIEDGALVAAATDPPASPEAKSLRIPVGQGVSGWIAATGEPVYIPDITVDPRIHLNSQVSGGVRSYFGMPLILHGEPTGVVQIDAPQIDAFTPEERGRSLAFVPTIAAAVQNAQIFHRELETVEKLRDAERLQNDFLAVVSHELRTPLTSLTGFAALLADRAAELSPDILAEAGRRIYRSGQHLERLISDLLDLTRLEHDALRAELFPTEVGAVIRDLALEYEFGSREIRVDVQPGLPPILTDAGRLRQVLGNLLTNALKFSPEGSAIEVRARFKVDRVEITVEDRGRGISADKLSRIFDRFFQIESSDRRSAGGLGIGLYVVKRLCEVMHATVGVESEVGKGSRFTVSMPPASR